MVDTRPIMYRTGFQNGYEFDMKIVVKFLDLDSSCTRSSLIAYEVGL